MPRDAGHHYGSLQQYYRHIEKHPKDELYRAIHKSKSMRTRNVPKTRIQYNCTSLPKTASNRWIRAESERTGLCNQYFAVYSYLAAAFYFNSSIVLGGLYSRSSFELRWPLKKNEWIKLPFSAFFDLPYFTHFWKLRGVHVVEASQYDHCPDDSLKVVKMIRYPEFWPYHYAVKMEMIRYNNLSIPLPENIMIEIVAPQKFVNFGNLFEFPKLLVDVHLSLQPSPLLHNYIALIVKHLPSDYIVAHLRLEGDIHGLLSKEVVHSKIDEAIAYMIQNTTCFHHLKKDPETNKFLKAPALYLSTGIFMKEQNLDGNFHIAVDEHAWKSTLSIVQYTLLKLYEFGIDTIYTKEIMISLMKKSMNQEELTQINFAAYDALYPEQLAFIDLQVARYAKCFCPAYVQSSFSYFALRHRALDRHEDLHMALVTPDKYPKNSIFGSWGV